MKPSSGFLDLSTPVGPPNANPFREQIIVVARILNPQFPSWALAILIFFAILRGILILVCASIMVIPLWKGPASRKKHWFLFRRIYPQLGRGIPYVVPNRSMVIAVCELCSSVLYSAVNFKTYKHLGIAHGDRGWYLALCLCDVTDVKSSRLPRLLTPIVYNTTWISWSIITIALIAYWAIRMGRHMFDAQRTCDRLLELLKRAAISWERHDNAQSFWGDLLPTLILAVHGTQLTGTLIVGWCITWIALAVGLAVLLLRMLNQILSKRELDTMVVDAQLSSPIWEELEKEFRLLCKTSSLLTLSIISQLFELAYEIYSGKNLTQIASALVTQLPGVFMTPALLVQSWRILTERSDETKFQQVPLAFEDQNIPQMTSHILGWDTTAFWDNQTELEIVNFPGLCEVQSINSRKMEDNTSITKQNLTDDISVVRSIVVTREEIEIIPMPTNPCF
ncbi:hypothetical protein DFH28DRAFT_923766 [Melampsora americana]|nr:hypothetical protein DFH28DRAFT_923766 [Melampsora americana]